MPKILITGGLGNLGSWLTEHFALNGFEVYVLAKNFRQIVTTAKYHLIQCDISEFSEVKTKLSDYEFEYVIHAGSVNDGFVENYFKLALDVNTLGTRNLLEFYKDKKLKNFIYFSTFQVYGKYEGEISEVTPTEPKNDYGATHLFAEYYVKQFHASHQLPYSIVRLSNSYGCPKDYNSSKWYLVLNDLAKSAFEKKEIILKSNGQAPRDFIWMGDVCQIIYQLIEKQATNETYNISGETTYKMIDIANEVKMAYLERFKVEIPVKVNLGDKTVHNDSLKVNASKLKELIQYNAEPHFKDEALKIFGFLEKRN
ncbi:MAG: NAD-dependent epimerase/dehydratase family protein [Cytophagales bacterium]